MTLFACPNELVEQIIREVANDDIENLASTCKLIRNLSKARLQEHYRLKRKYGYKLNYPAKRALHPAEILDAVIEEPQAARYIKTLSLSYRAPTRSNDRYISSLLEKHGYFWNVLVENPLVPDGELFSWHGRISKGHIDALYALLLFYLHDLRELRIQRPILIPMTFVMISRLKNSVNYETLEKLPCGADLVIESEPPNTKHPDMGLAKLERVIIDPATSSDEAHLRNRMADFSRFASFSSFPQLQHLNGMSLVSRNLGHEFHGFSNLRSIRLINSFIHPEDFRKLFSGINGLESFHYVPAADVTNLTPVVDDLRKYAGHSLTRLYLRHSAIEERVEPWRYRGFEHLKRVDLDWHCLVHQDMPVEASSSSMIHTNSQPSASGRPPPSPKKKGRATQKIYYPPLVDLMPSTVESIKIVDLDGKANLEAIRWLFFKLSLGTARFPNLKVVVFVTPRRDCWLHAKEICLRAKLKFPAYSCEREKRITGLEFVYE